MSKDLSDSEVKQIFDLYRRGNDLPRGDFPTLKNGLKPFVKDGNPGFLVDSGTLEYLRSQHLDRLHDLPVEQGKLDGFKEQVRELREEFYDRSALPKSMQNNAFGYFEKVIIQGEIADIFTEELQKNGFDGDKAKEATRSFYERAWPALKRGYSIQDVRKGERSGVDDLNGPEGKVFDLPPIPTSSLPKSNAPDKRQASSSEKKSVPGSLTERGRNPFNVKSPNLNQQAEMLERNPAQARQLIVAARRDPQLFGL
jgi:hypothetical protein